jgi:ankyrin repeat protein
MYIIAAIDAVLAQRVGVLRNTGTVEELKLHDIDHPTNKPIGQLMRYHSGDALTKTCHTQHHNTSYSIPSRGVMCAACERFGSVELSSIIIAQEELLKTGLLKASRRYHRSNMARKKVQKKMRETTLVPHRTPNRSALLERVKSDDSALAIRAYLDAGGSADVHVLSYEGSCFEKHIPLLHYLALHNKHPHTELAESVRLLIEAGADISAVGPDNDTPLMCASKRDCCTAVLDILLQHGANALVCAADGETALHKAIELRRTDSCRLLLARDSSLALMKDADQCTALMYAVALDSLDTLEVLCQHGADVNTVAKSNITPLMMVVGGKSLQMASYLIKTGADVNADDNSGNTALIEAAKVNNVALAQLLLDHGADISITDKKGQNALFKAADSGHVDMMVMLVKNGLSITSIDRQGSTLLMTALTGGHKAAAEWLLHQGVAVICWQAA